MAKLLVKSSEHIHDSDHMNISTRFSVSCFDFWLSRGDTILQDRKQLWTAKRKKLGYRWRTFEVVRSVLSRNHMPFNINSARSERDWTIRSSTNKMPISGGKIILLGRAWDREVWYPWRNKQHTPHMNWSDLQQSKYLAEMACKEDEERKFWGQSLVPLWIWDTTTCQLYTLRKLDASNYNTVTGKWRLLLLWSSSQSVCSIFRTQF